MTLICVTSTVARVKFPDTSDSLRIIGFQHDFEDPPFTREVLSEYVGNSKNENIENWVDTVITNSQEISHILSSIKRLKPVKKMRFSAEECIKKGTYGIFKNNIVWSSIETLDYRLLILVFNEKTVNFIWIDNFYLERGYYRYKLSEELKKELSNYTDFFIRY